MSQDDLSPRKASAITYEGAVVPSQPTSDNKTTLFAGQKLYFSHSVPLRKWLSQNAEANGAVVTTIDTQADVVLFDHAKNRNAPPGSFSYKYVELSIRNGVLERLEDHRIASDVRANRPVGSVTTAPKGTRNAYTDAEDQLLWNWIKPLVDAGGAWKGNEIYRQLESHNPRHTYQSWRDRWIKHTQYQNRQITQHNLLETSASSQTEAPVEPSPKRRKAAASTQDLSASGSQRQRKTVEQPTIAETENQAMPQREIPSRSAAEVEVAKTERMKRMSSFLEGFTRHDIRILMSCAPKFLLADPADRDRGWQSIASENLQHTSDEWKACFEMFIVPEFRRSNGLDTDEKLDQYLRKFAVESGENAQDEQGNSTVNKHTGASPSASQDLAPEIDDMHIDLLTMRPPEPNESRKRSHGRSTQSDSAQSQSQPSSQTHVHSRTFSKSSRIPRKSEDSEASWNTSLSDIPYRSEPGRLSRNASLSPSMQRTTEMLPSTQHARAKRFLIQNDTSPQNRRSSIPTNTAFANSPSRAQKRNVTESAGSQRTRDAKRKKILASRASADADDEWIPPRSQDESPMFFPDESREASDASASEDVSRDDGHMNTGSVQGTQYYDAATFTQEFETAPPGRIFQPFSSQISLDQLESVQVEPQEKSGKLDQRTDETQFETAPSQQPDAPKSPQGQTPRSIRSEPQHETQRHQPMLAESNGIGDFSIPPPEGGWSDDEDDVGSIEEDVRVAIAVKQEMTSAKKQISPRPDTAASEDDIEKWLSKQKEFNYGTHEFIVDEICIKVLEATSLQLHVATTVVNALIRSYVKGKHPAIEQVNQFVDDTGEPRKLSKRDTKKMRVAISKMVEEMMLTDHKGVWTKSDDQKLMSTNARDVEEVERKHGEDGVRLRFEYLDQLYQDA